MTSETIANGTTEIIHKLDLNEYGLRDVPEADKQAAKKEVADYLENQILREVNAGTSPVQGEGRFKRLESEYAVREKGGNRLSDLEKDGDLLNDFKVTPDEDSFLEVGHKGDQTPKADGHNQLSGKAKAWAKQIGFPRRRYIPDDTQKFTPKITGEIEKIITEFKPAPGTREVTTEPTSVITTAEQTTVTTEDLFSDDVIDSLLEDALRRRGL